MKLLVTLFCLASFKIAHGFSEEFMGMLKVIHDTCSAETGVDVSLIDRAVKGDFVPDPAFKCYIKCIMKIPGAISNDGTIDVDKMIMTIPEELRESIAQTIRKCGTQRGVDPCDTAFLTSKCYQMTNPEEYYLF